MNIDNAFPSEFVKASDFEQPALLTMSVVEKREVGDDHKPVLFFNEIEKGLVLNKTNASFIQALFGPHTEQWAGKQIVVFAAETDYQGKRVPCVRVRAAKTGKPAAHQPQPLAISEEELPF